MFVVNHHFDVFVIDGPWSNIAEILHVFVGAGNDDLGLCSTKLTAVPGGVVGGDVEQLLQAGGGVAGQVEVVGHAGHAHHDRADGKSEGGVVKGVEGRMTG